MPQFSQSIDSSLTSVQRDFVTKFLIDKYGEIEISYGDDELVIGDIRNMAPEDVGKTLKQALFISRSINREVIFENRPEISSGKDPQPYLEKIGEVQSIKDGFFMFQGNFLKVFHSINAKVREFASELGAIEQEYPTIWPVDLYKKINYFYEFPQQLIMCATVKNDFESRNKFAEKYKKENEFESIEIDELFEESTYGLESAVCDCCYYALSGTKDNENHYYTCYNKVFRNENSKTRQLDRITNFSVRDIMFVGSETFVLESREVLIRKISQFLSALELNCKIETANDPFFTNQAAMKSVFQNSSSLKYELLAEIPHLGKAIAVGSINNHLDMFSQAFDFKTPSGGMAHSGCIGVGMERLVYALHCQHGERVEDWPVAVRQYLNV